MPALRHPDPPRRVHEPLVVLLPALPAAAAPRPLVAALTRSGYCGRPVADGYPCNRRLEPTEGSQ